jgi:hypothetical protein
MGRRLKTTRLGSVMAEKRQQDLPLVPAKRGRTDTDIVAVDARTKALVPGVSCPAMLNCPCDCKRRQKTKKANLVCLLGATTHLESAGAGDAAVGPRGAANVGLLGFKCKDMADLWAG